MASLSSSSTRTLKALLPILLTLHEARVKKDRDFQYLQEDIAEARLQRKRNLVSLNEAERRQERDAQETRFMSREARKDGGKSAGNDVTGNESAPAKASALQDDGLRPGERNLANQLAAEKARKNAKDVLLNEAVNILGDQVTLLKAGGRLVTRVKPESRLTRD